MSLDEYNKKRNFEKTSEPRGYKEIGSGFPLEAIGIKAREREVIKIEDSMSHTSETDSAEPNSAARLCGARFCGAPEVCYSTPPCTQ